MYLMDISEQNVPLPIPDSSLVSWEHQVKTFVGTSAQALKTQLWTALIAMLLVKYLQLKSIFDWSLSNLVALLRQQLFVYRDLWTWIDNPFQPPPVPETLPEQLALQLS